MDNGRPELKAGRRLNKADVESIVFAALSLVCLEESINREPDN
jgi:hypothetical protein